MKYIPKGGMCATCIHTDRNCMGLSFSKMPIISRTEDLIIVKCTEYERKTYPIETPKKLKQHMRNCDERLS